MNATVCACPEMHLLPVGVLAVYDSGTIHGLADCDPAEVA